MGRPVGWLVAAVVLGVGGCGDNSDNTPADSPEDTPELDCATVGARILFQSTRSGTAAFPDLYVADGSRFTMVGSALFNSPKQWSGDGARVLYVTMAGFTYEVVQVDDTGNNFLALTTSEAVEGDFELSPDGTRIVYEDNAAMFPDLPRDVYVQAIGATTRTQILAANGDQGSPTWSPDGSRIALRSGTAVVSVAPDGTAPQTIGGGATGVRAIRFSPDGTRIAFIGDKTLDPGIPGLFSITVADSDGGNPAELPTPTSVFDLAWSPDSTRIAYTRLVDGPVEEELDIFVVAADGTGEVQLTTSPGHDTSPRWSPDGSYIFFDTARDGAREIYRMNADGTDQRNLTNDRADDYRPEVTSCL